MKANDAPDRLYLSNTIYSTFVYQVPDPDDETAVEYTQTDVLVDKACEWIKYNNNNGGCQFDGWEEDFKKYMKGE